MDQLNSEKYTKLIKLAKKYGECQNDLLNYERNEIGGKLIQTEVCNPDNSSVLRIKEFNKRNKLKKHSSKNNKNTDQSKFTISKGMEPSSQGNLWKKTNTETQVLKRNNIIKSANSLTKNSCEILPKNTTNGERKTASSILTPAELSIDTHDKNKSIKQPKSTYKLLSMDSIEKIKSPIKEGTEKKSNKKKMNGKKKSLTVKRNKSNVLNRTNGKGIHTDVEGINTNNPIFFEKKKKTTELLKRKKSTLKRKKKRTIKKKKEKLSNLTNGYFIDLLKLKDRDMEEKELKEKGCCTPNTNSSSDKRSQLMAPRHMGRIYSNKIVKCDIRLSPITKSILRNINSYYKSCPNKCKIKLKPKVKCLHKDAGSSNKFLSKKKETTKKKKEKKHESKKTKGKEENPKMKNESTTISMKSANSNTTKQSIHNNEILSILHNNSRKSSINRTSCSSVFKDNEQNADTVNSKESILKNNEENQKNLDVKICKDLLKSLNSYSSLVYTMNCKRKKNKHCKIKRIII